MNGKRITVLLLLTAIFVGTLQLPPLAGDFTANTNEFNHIDPGMFTAYFDSENISITLITPANQSTLVGTVNITIDVVSDYDPLNLTLFVEDEIYEDLNRTEISVGLQNVTIDTLNLPEGSLNFTFLFENASFGAIDRESYPLVFEVDNHGYPSVEILAPDEDELFTGLDSLYLNISADYTEVYLNITINGVPTEEWNGSELVPVGAANYTINGSRYENGDNLVDVVVVTEEGLSDEAEAIISFLDHVRFSIIGITNFGEVSGEQEITIRVFTPYDSVNLTVSVDGDVADDVSNITVPEGRSDFTMDTTGYSEGEHEFLFTAYDGFGHSWSQNLTFIVNNHREPSISFTAPAQDIIVGLAEFTVNIETTYSEVFLSVYVDGDAVDVLTNITAPAGAYAFNLDTTLYTKWQHEVKVVVTTVEGLSAEAASPFGFANFRIEEILSAIVLIGIALSIPLMRFKRGESVRMTLIVDVIFILVVVGIFLALGVTSLPLMIWHINLASIWAIGTTLVATNWLVPLFTTATEQ
jgi:hypothetical protein